MPSPYFAGASSVKLRILILNTDYSDFLDWLYRANPGLSGKPYSEQMRVRTNTLFGVADFYSHGLAGLGHVAEDIFVNNLHMQLSWARERPVPPKRLPTQSFVRALRTFRGARSTIRSLPLGVMRRPLRRLARAIDSLPEWIYEVVSAQIEEFRPDVILNQSLDGVSPDFMARIKSETTLLVAQHAHPWLEIGESLSCYGLLISSIPASAPVFKPLRQAGIPYEYHRLAFERRVLERLPPRDPSIDVSFIGSFHSAHSSRLKLIEYLCARFPQIRIWGSGIEAIPSASAVRGKFQGQAWGLDMYRILRSSKITINHHGDVGDYANNLRLFEATGVGCLLVTDQKSNLGEIFEVGKEVVSYETPEECGDMIEYYLGKNEERERIALGGQERTLRDHTYETRMRELVDIFNKHLDRSRRP